MLGYPGHVGIQEQNEVGFAHHPLAEEAPMVGVVPREIEVGGRGFHHRNLERLAQRHQVGDGFQVTPQIRRDDKRPLGTPQRLGQPGGGLPGQLTQDRW